MLWAFLATSATAQFGREPSGPVIEPVLDLTFPNAPLVHSAAISPDGKTVYAHMWVEGFNAWAAVVYYWPELLGAVAGILAILLAAWIARVAGRRRRPGEMHCRRCNYCLTGLSSLLGTERSRESRCPECAADLARRAPIRGTAMWRRLAAPIAMLTLVAGGYGSLWALGASRSGSAQTWFRWPNKRVETWLTARSAALAKRCSRPWDRIVAVDVASRHVRTVWQRVGGMGHLELRLRPDGGALFVEGRGPRWLLEEIDSRSGRTLARMPRPAPGASFGDSGPFPPRGIAGFSPDGAKVFVAFVDSDRGKTGVAAWAPRTGETRVLLEEDAFVVSRGGGRSAIRRFHVLGDGGSRRFLSGPGFMEAFQSKRYVVRVHENGAMREMVVSPPLRRDGQAAVAPISTPLTVTPDGSTAIVPALMQILCIDLETGESLPELSEFEFDSMIDPSDNGLVLEPSGRMLYAPEHRGIRVRDMFRHEWVGSLRMPSNLIAPEMYIAADGRSMVVIPFGSNGGVGAGPFIHHLLVYDLSDVEKWVAK